MTTTKQVEWSYPTSTNAARFGFNRVGCWTLSLIVYEAASGHTITAVLGTESKETAMSAASEMPFPWSAAMLHCHPELRL